MGRAIGGTAEKVRAIAEAQGLDDFDGHALAGFIEAEGSFFIQPNNGGRSWVCGMTLTQRADDADMLVDIARVTGLGRLHSLSAQRKSRPQVCWSVASKLESLELARLLRQYPLRRRKRHEFSVWARAVDEWTQTLYGRGDARGDRLMRSSAEELRRLRRYVDQPSGLGSPLAAQDAQEGLTAFLGGFFTGEGTFGLSGRALACVHLRADDADLLRGFRDQFGIGKLAFSTPRGANPTVRWDLCRKAEVPHAMAVLDRAMLRGRKRREFEAWRVGAAEYARGRDRDRAIIAAAAATLHRARTYVDRAIALPVPGSGVGSSRAVLQAFAAEVTDGALTCTAYELARARHPEWPTRNTITLAFGSWAEALRAAGLGSRGSDWAHRRGSPRLVGAP
jgi:hypothetical protein